MPLSTKASQLQAPANMATTPLSMQRPTALLLLILASVLWSSGGFLIKLVDWNPMAISGARSLIAALFLLGVMRPRRPELSAPMLGGALAYAATVTLVVIATCLTTAANAIFLQSTSPLFVAVFGIFFLREHPTRLDWATLAIILCGMLLFFIDSLDAKGFWGNLAGLGSGIGFAWLTLFLRKQKNGNPAHSIILGNMLAALIGLPFMFQSLPDLRGGLALLLLGVVQIGLPYWLYALAIRRINALESVLTTVLEPLLNPLWVFLLIGETPGQLPLIGGALILSTLILRALLPRKDTDRQR